MPSRLRRLRRATPTRTKARPTTCVLSRRARGRRRLDEIEQRVFDGSVLVRIHRGNALEGDAELGGGGHGGGDTQPSAHRIVDAGSQEERGGGARVVRRGAVFDDLPEVVFANTGIAVRR